MAKVAARFVGAHALVLSKYGGPFKDGNGKRLASLLLNPGDTLMVEEEEVTGCTWLHDPRHEAESVKLGLGVVILPDHMHLSDAERNALGYEVHEPSGLWEYMTPPQVVAQAASKAASKAVKESES